MIICSTSLQKRLIQEFNLLVLLTSRRVEWFRSFAGQMIRTRSWQKSNLGSMWNMYVLYLLVITKGYRVQTRSMLRLLLQRCALRERRSNSRDRITSGHKGRNVRDCWLNMCPTCNSNLEIRDAFHSTKTFENLETAANGPEFSGKVSILKFWKPVNFRNTNHSTENSRNSAAKVEW